ncbi:MAG: hypothetical protein QW146_02920 [Candidatus Bathyarchaeia archaeon]
MKIGIVSYQPERVKGFDFQIYYAKRADGSVFPPAEHMYNDITCFCDAKTIRESPEMAAVSKEGLALRKNRKINMPWDYICPTHENYREKILRFIEDMGDKKIQGVILNLYHFPEEGFCVCPRCMELWRLSGLNWVDWRVQTVTSFIKEAREKLRNVKAFAVEIWPDPVLSRERFGIDFDQLAKYVDFFHIPLSANDYTTMYWVDMLTRIFTKILQKPVYIELSAEMLNEVKLGALLKTMAYVSRHNVEGIFLLVHSCKNAEEVCEYAVKNGELQKWFERHGFTRIMEIVEKWKSFY